MYEASLRSDVSQGDIFQDVPVLYARAFRNIRADAPAGITEANSDVHHVTAVVLTHDCEYDKKATSFVYVARIVSIAKCNDSLKGYIRENRVLSAFHLEVFPEQFDESYADFGRISRVSKEWFESYKSMRLLSMSEESRLALQYQLARYFGHERQLPKQNPASLND